MASRGAPSRVPCRAPLSSPPACLRRLASLSATSSWFSVNHAIRFSSSATPSPVPPLGAPPAVPPRQLCRSLVVLLVVNSRVHSAAHPARHLRLRRSRRRSRRVALANELALALAKLQLRRLERRLGGELPLQVSSPVAAGALRLESKPSDLAVSRSIVPVKSPSLDRKLASHRRHRRRRARSPSGTRA